MANKIRNVAIIAHVDHGKTTLVDALLKQTGTVGKRHQESTRIMDSNDLEKERGITILSKNTSINYKGVTINIVDTPGHADFGGEVERILSMVDSVLLLVDASEGPMPQTRFVTQKAFENGLSPIVVVNKVDRPTARIDGALDEVFDLFDKLGATDEQLDFPVVFASALQGFATMDMAQPNDDMTPLLDLLIDKVPPPDVDLEGALQMQITSLSYSSYVGTIGTGRIKRGCARVNQQVIVVDREGKERKAKISQLYGFEGLERVNIEEAQAGQIIALSGIEPINISDTICGVENVEALPALTVDEPTITMTFQVNDSPLAGLEGKFVTGRHLHDRLQKELLSNVALRVERDSESDHFRVSGRGELHLSVLIETMRREGFEFAVSRPQVLKKEIDGELCEPIEQLLVDIEEDHQGSVMQMLADVKANMLHMQHDGHGRVRIEYHVPTRGLIGFHSRFLTLTSGSGLVYHTFDHYGPVIKQDFKTRKQGVLISNMAGVSSGYALWNLESRGRLLIGPQVKVYEGMIVGIHSRANDLVVNVCKGKQLTNVRASGSDDNIVLTPPVKQSLEDALAFIADDELVEITPENLRLRKKFLKEHERKRASRS